ncbi:unnamed protein product [Coccothraustes coccothraustes]
MRHRPRGGDPTARLTPGAGASLVASLAPRQPPGALRCFPRAEATCARGCCGQRSRVLSALRRCCLSCARPACGGRRLRALPLRCRRLTRELFSNTRLWSALDGVAGQGRV